MAGGGGGGGDGGLGGGRCRSGGGHEAGVADGLGRRRGRIGRGLVVGDDGERGCGHRQLARDVADAVVAVDCTRGGDGVGAADDVAGGAGRGGDGGRGVGSAREGGRSVAIDQADIAHRQGGYGRSV